MNIQQATQEPLSFQIVELDNDDYEEATVPLEMSGIEETHQEVILGESRKRRLEQEDVDSEEQKAMNPKKKKSKVMNSTLAEYMNGLMKRNNIPKTTQNVLESLEEQENGEEPVSRGTLAGEKTHKKNKAYLPFKKSLPKKKRATTKEKPRSAQTLLSEYMPPAPKEKLVDFEKRLYQRKHWKALHYILVWFNYTLVDRMFHKQYSGLYLWSYGKTLGKTLLCSVISKIVNCYWWVFQDEGWQQDWDDDKKYDCIIYNAINSDILEHRQVELHGDRKPIPVKRRNQRLCAHVDPETPFIITSNKPPEKLGYKEKGQDIEVWTKRMLIVCVDECPLWDLIEQMERRYNVVMQKEPPKPRLKHCRI